KKANYWELKKIIPENAEFPELYNEPPSHSIEHDATLFLLKRESLRKLKQLDEITTFQEMKDYFVIKSSDYWVGVRKTGERKEGKKTFENYEYDTSEALYRKHQGIIAAFERIHANSPEEDFKLQIEQGILSGGRING